MPLSAYLRDTSLFLLLATAILLLMSSGSLYVLFWVWRNPNWQKWRLKNSGRNRARPWKEATLTFLNLMVYIYPFLIAVAVEYVTGYTARYESIAKMGWPYFFASIAFFLFVVDADFYWTHRFLHRRARAAHAVHHQFTDPTPWCGFAFHFYESFLLALPYVPLLLLVPWHPLAVATVQITAMVWNAFLHLGYDPIPISWKSQRPLRWLMTARDHCGHHQNPASNFGLYFTYWDELLGTRSRAND